MSSLPFRFGIGVQHIGREELEAAARAGRKVSGLAIGWTHLSRQVTPELAAKALGRWITIGVTTGFGRVERPTL
jgi:hypothetical protein